MKQRPEPYWLPISAFFLLSILGLTQSYGSFEASRSSATTLAQYLGLVILIGGCLWIGRRRLLHIRSTLAGVCLMSFLLYAFFSTLWSLRPADSAVYGLTLIAITAALGLASSANPAKLQRALILAAWVALLSTLSLPLFLPLRDRSFGWITPNLIASIGFVVIVLATASRAKLSWVPVIGGLGLIAFAEGRTVLLSTLTYLLLLGLRKIVTRPDAQILCFALLAALALVFSSFWEDTVRLMISIASAPLGVSDSSRLDTTLTGRSDLWQHGWRLFNEHPYFGLGLATRDGYDSFSGYLTLNPHSGFISLLLDLGVVGAALFFLALWTAWLRFFRLYHQRHAAIAWSGLSFLSSYAILLIVEPNYIQATHPISIVLLLFLSTSLFRPPQETGELNAISATAPKPRRGISLA